MSAGDIASELEGLIYSTLPENWRPAIEDRMAKLPPETREKILFYLNHEIARLTTRNAALKTIRTIMTKPPSGRRKTPRQNTNSSKDDPGPDGLGVRYVVRG